MHDEGLACNCFLLRAVQEAAHLVLLMPLPWAVCLVPEAWVAQTFEAQGQHAQNLELVVRIATLNRT